MRSASASNASATTRKSSIKTCFTIFHVDGEAGLRGGERQLLYLAAALSRRGHINIVVCRPASPLEKNAGLLNLQTHPMNFHGEWDLLAARELYRLARLAPNPILHAHTAHAAAWVALAGLGGIASVSHRRVDFSLSGLWPSRLKYNAASRVVGVSSAVRDIMVRGGVKAEKIKVVHDSIPVDIEECAWAGVPRDHFAPSTPELKAALRRRFSSAFGLPQDAAWIGNLAALVPHKDQETLVNAANHVIRENPKTIFLIAGAGPLAASLKEQIEKLGLNGRVFLLGQINEPMDFLRSLDIFCLSSWGEGMGSVLLEASACALPIAATSAGGIPEIIVHGRSGLISPPRKPDALAANIKSLLLDQDLAKNLGARARTNLADFGLKRQAARMEAIYEEACHA